MIPYAHTKATDSIALAKHYCIQTQTETQGKNMKLSQTEMADIVEAVLKNLHVAITKAVADEIGKHVDGNPAASVATNAAQPVMLTADVSMLPVE